MARTKVVDTVEFEEAVTAKATQVAETLFAAKMQELVAAAAQGAGNAAPPAVSGATGGAVDVLGDILSKLSSSLQAVAQQGERRRPLTAEEVVRRESAEHRMWKLIEAAQKANDPDRKPTYKLTSKIYFNERFIEPFKVVDRKAVNNEITWTGVPNDAMVPINDVSREIFAAWQESTGGPTNLVPTADRRPLYVTAAGLTVRGDPPKRQQVHVPENFAHELGFANNDPNAPEIAVLGTIAAKARQNAVTGVGIAAVSVT